MTEHDINIKGVGWSRLKRMSVYFKYTHKNTLPLHTVWPTGFISGDTNCAPF
jgi:hypothetical protein